MGLYDRDYYQGSSRGEREYYHIQPQQSWVFAIIIVNIMVFFANAVRGDDLINGMMVMKSTTLAHPTEWWRLITYAFAHGGLMHLVFNMLALFIFGPLVERKYGPVEFMCFYFITAILSGIVWGAFHFNVIPIDQFGNVLGPQAMLGASGAISGVIMIVICSYPRMPIYIWGILEMPMWLMGVLFIGSDLLGFFGYSGGRDVAYEAHLAGVAFGALYWWLNWRVTDIPRLFSRQYWQERKRRQRFFNPKNYTDRYSQNNKNGDDDKSARSEQVDEILRKISEKGQDSLTWKERRILKQASREYQKKNKPE